MARGDLRELGELGERGLVEWLQRRAGSAGRRWPIGIGDDAAVLRPRAGHELVVCADALIEDVHFRWRTADAAALGSKALRVNLSDLGAMGAEPLGCLLTLGLPAETPRGRLQRFVSGLLRTAGATGCPLVGGDCVRAPLWTLSLTALGELPRGRALVRSGAHAGDRLLVSGTLGGAALGLTLLEGDDSELPGAAAFVRRHRDPETAFRAGIRLRKSGLATAAIDLSDGLLPDLERLARQSGLGADVDLDRLPRARGYLRLCEAARADPEALALVGGEDYELLFTVGPRAPSAAELGRRLQRTVTEIGVMRAGRDVRLLRAGRRVPAPPPGFAHFKSR